MPLSSPTTIPPLWKGKLLRVVEMGDDFPVSFNTFSHTHPPAASESHDIWFCSPVSRKSLGFPSPLTILVSSDGRSHILERENRRNQKHSSEYREKLHTDLFLFSPVCNAEFFYSRIIFISEIFSL